MFEFIQDNEWDNARRPDSSLTYNQQFAERLRAAGWRVRVFDQGRVPDYGERYRLAYELLGETDERQLRIRFNKVNTRDVLTAMSLAPVKQGNRGQIEKIKAASASSRSVRRPPTLRTRSTCTSSASTSTWPALPATSPVACSS